MSEILILYICSECEKEHYFEENQIPGGEEHCEYCESCSGLLVTGNPFNLICLNCGHSYDGVHNNTHCPECWEKENIRWMLKSDFRKIIKNPGECTVENIKLKFELTFDLGVQ